jgi:hypothetical protein
MTVEGVARSALNAFQRIHSTYSNVKEPIPSLRAQAKQSMEPQSKNGLLRRFAPLRKRFAFVAGNDASN